MWQVLPVFWTGPCSIWIAEIWGCGTSHQVMWGRGPCTGSQVHLLLSWGWAGNKHPLGCSPQGSCLRTLHVGRGTVCGCSPEGSGQSTVLEQRCSRPFRSRPDPLQRSALLAGAAHARYHCRTGRTCHLSSRSLLQALESLNTTNVTVASLPCPSRVGSSS